MLIGNSGNTCQVQSAAACLETLLFLLLYWKKKNAWVTGKYVLYHFFPQVSAGFQCYSDFGPGCRVGS